MEANTQEFKPAKDRRWRLVNTMRLCGNEHTLIEPFTQCRSPWVPGTDALKYVAGALQFR
jgi:hypothetical protein